MHMWPVVSETSIDPELVSKQLMEDSGVEVLFLNRCLFNMRPDRHDYICGGMQFTHSSNEFIHFSRNHPTR